MLRILYCVSYNIDSMTVIHFALLDLINDWSSRNPADVLHHIPYTWFLNFCLKEFELVTIANQYNWVDCSSQRQENGKLFSSNYLFDILYVYFKIQIAYAAFSGDFLELAFALPFTDFLSPSMELKFRIQVHIFIVALLFLICFEFHQYIVFIHFTGRVS